MTPVQDLTPQQAVEELASIMDSKPDDDAILDIIKWKQKNDDRIKELEAFILREQGTTAPEPEQPAEEEPAPTTEPEEATEETEPEPEAAPEEPPPSQDYAYTCEAIMKPTPEPVPPAERMASLVARLEQTTRDSIKSLTAHSFKRRKATISNLRFQIKRMATLHGLEMPKLPDIPQNPFTRKGPPATRTVSATERKPEPPAAPEPAQAPPPPAAPKGTSHRVLKGMRRDFWLILHDLETIPAQECEDMRSDLALLEAQCQQALLLIDERTAALQRSIP